MKTYFAFCIFIFISVVSYSQDIGELSTCMECHSDDELYGDIDGKEVLVFIDENLFTQSVHADLSCIDCHEDIEEEIHNDVLQPVDCAMCHEDQSIELSESVHRPTNRNQCAACHGNAHYIVPRDHADSLLSPTAVNQQCLSCHITNDNANSGLVHSGTSSFHLTLTTPDGQPINCSQCHGSHHIMKSDDPKSLIHPANAQNTCGACHAEEKLAFEKSIHGQTLAMGSEDAAACTSCHIEHEQDYEFITQNKMWIHNTCGQCHFDEMLMDQYGIGSHGLEQLMQHSVHAEEVRAGNPKAPVCSDCHGYHDILALNNPESNIFFQNVAETCGKCHVEEKEQYLISVHGVSSARGHKESPVCTDCHGEHAVLRTDDIQSPVHQLNLSKSTCARCHESVVLSDKYNMNFGQVESYFDSYHGLAVNWGSKEAANCGSCHGNHMILPSTDPRSTISSARLVETCGQCHPGISSNVLLSSIHRNNASGSNSIAGWVQWIYIVLIFAVVGGMILHNALIYFAIVKEKHRKDLKTKTYKRFNRFEIFSHLVLTISFTLLVVTGFALVFTDSWWVNLLNSIGFTEEVRAWLHRIAGVALIAISLAYAFYMLFTQRGRLELYHFSPSFTDIKHLLQCMLYYLGFSKTFPKFGRYDYTEKLEFWALVWGVIIMAVTGLILWYPVFVMNYLPKWVIDIAEVVHYYEAILAALAIFIWHFFFVIYHPDEYPMNTSWVDGKMTLEKLKHRHPLEYEEVKKQTSNNEPEEE